MPATPSRPRDAAESVRLLLHVVRSHLRMQAAWTSEFAGDDLVFRYVDAEPGAPAPREGRRMPLSASYAVRVRDGRMPSFIPDTRCEPAVALLDRTGELEIGSYLGVPLVGADGTVSGMLCATGRDPKPQLSERDVATLDLVAELLHDLQVRALDAEVARERKEDLIAELSDAIEGEGRHAVLQPIVDVRTGDVVAVEGLARFDSERTPAQWFDVAHRMSLTVALESAAATSVLDLLRDGAVPDGAAVHVNLGPDTVVDADLEELLDGVDPERVVVEMTEHRPVQDYALLLKTLVPWRERGLRVGVDDVGAGYSSMQHVLRCSPDVVKLDMALVRDVDTDKARQAIVRAGADFARTSGIQMVAEGVETEAERETLARLGVPLQQGFLFGRPA